MRNTTITLFRPPIASFRWTEINTDLTRLNEIKDENSLKTALLNNDFFRKNKLQNFDELVNLTDKDNVSLLMFAAANDCHRIINLLIKEKVNINFQGCYQATALHIACELGKGKAIEALLLNGIEKIDITLKDENGETARDLAQKLDDKTTFKKETNSHIQHVHDSDGIIYVSAHSVENEPAKKTICELFTTYSITKSTIEAPLQKNRCVIL